jgi:hypothetical protein
MFGRMIDRTLHTNRVLVRMVDPPVWGVNQSVDSSTHHTFEHLCSTLCIVSTVVSMVVCL